MYTYDNLHVNCSALSPTASPVHSPVPSPHNCHARTFSAPIYLPSDYAHCNITELCAIINVYDVIMDRYSAPAHSAGFRAWLLRHGAHVNMDFVLQVYTMPVAELYSKYITPRAIQISDVLYEQLESNDLPVEIALQTAVESICSHYSTHTLCGWLQSMCTNINSSTRAQRYIIGIVCTMISVCVCTVGVYTHTWQYLNLVCASVNVCALYFLCSALYNVCPMLCVLHMYQRPHESMSGTIQRYLHSVQPLQHTPSKISLSAWLDVAVSTRVRICICTALCGSMCAAVLQYVLTYYLAN